MSTEVTTEMMNEVIARFMGGTRIQHPEQIFFSEDHFGYVCHKGHWWNENNLQYHTSWDWLMPVVEKIESVQLDDKRHVVVRASANVQIFYRACIITYEPDEGSGDTNEGAAIQTKGETKLQAVHAAVYQFITWYNQQKQTNEQ